MRILNSCVI